MTTPANSLFTRYRVTIQMRDRIVGGVPKRADVIEGWLRTNTGIEQTEELRAMTRRTLLEIGVDVPEEATFEQMVEASKALAAERSTVGFKVDPTLGLYIETRQFKAMLKECTAILFTGEEKWGKTKKGPKNYLAERVFLEGDRIYLDRMVPDGVEMMIGHVSGPQGPRSTLTYYEYVRAPRLVVTILSLRDSIELDHWQMILGLAQENGLGAVRSQGHGRFDVTDVARVVGYQKPTFVLREMEVLDAAPVGA